MKKYVTGEKWDKVNRENKELLQEFFLQLKQERLSERTIRTYSDSLRIFFVYILDNLNNKSILNLTKKDFRNYSLHLKMVMKVSNSTHNHYMSAIRSMLERMEEDDDIEYEVNMCRKLKGLKREPVRETTFLSDWQVEILYKELLKSKETYKYQMALFLALAYDSTGRRFEIMQVTKERFYDCSVSNTNEVIKKGGKKETLIYFSRTKEAAKLYLESRGDDTITSLWITKSGKQAQPNSANAWCDKMSKILTCIENKPIHFSPHDLRHSAIENYTEGSHYLCPTKRIAYSIEDIQKLASHASSAMTQLYKKDRGLKSIENAFGIKLVR